MIAAVTLICGVGAMFAQPASRLSAVETNIDHLEAADVDQKDTMKEINAHLRENTLLLREIKGAVMTTEKKGGGR